MIGGACLNWPRKVEELQSSATLERENSLAYLGVLEQRSCCSGYSKFTNAGHGEHRDASERQQRERGKDRREREPTIFGFFAVI